MGYNDGGEFNFSDSGFNGRKLRPLIPRPLPSVNTTTSSSTSANFVHGSNDFFTQYHHLATLTNQSKREFHAPPSALSSRWNPTPEQLRSLEELYRKGTRTPSADQIQTITAELRRFGKIEGKNVFYWFQNHKARERQKRRRKTESVASHQPRDYEVFERKDSEAGRTDQYEQIKSWAPPQNCITLAEESGSMEGAAKAAAMAECRTDGWIQLDEPRKNATWKLMMTTQSSSPSAVKPNPSCTAGPSATPTTELNSCFRYDDCRKTQNEEDDNGCRLDSDQTLELFPLSSYGGDSKDDEGGGKERGLSMSMSMSAINADLAPSQFFEFLPLKN